MPVSEKSVLYFDQHAHPIRCEWGLAGVNQLAPGSDAVVIVDIFSFSTCVDVASSRGGMIYPYAWRDERAYQYASSLDALLAVASRTDPRGFSLAPSSMLRLPPGTKVVLPSPNGAALSLATGATPTFAGCLRNAQAVAAAAARLGRQISVIPAGERWPDGGLRPALEDWLGAGAIVHFLPGERSPEAAAAEALFLHFREQLASVLSACASGLEAADRGSPRDVALAAELNVSPHAPFLVEGAYA